MVFGKDDGIFLSVLRDVDTGILFHEVELTESTAFVEAYNSLVNNSGGASIRGLLFHNNIQVAII